MRKSTGKIVAFILVLIILIVGSFSLFGSSDDDSYLFLLLTKQIKETKILNTNFFAEIADKDEEKVEAGQSDTISGLNLLLINNIGTECYVKELLTLLRDNQEGKLSNKTYKKTVPLTTSLAVWYSECGTYSGTILPESDLPWNSSKNSPYWNVTYNGLDAKYMTLNGFSKQAAAFLHKGLFNQGRGPFSYDGECKGVANVSGYNMDSSRKKGQVEYVPDGIVGLNDYLNDGCNSLGVDATKLSDQAISTVVAIAHNGGVGSGSIYGTAYARSGFVETSKESEENKASWISWYGDTVNKVTDNGKSVSKFVISDTTKYRKLAPILAIADGWYLEQNCYNFLTSDDSYKQSITWWNLVFPDKKVNSKSELQSALQPYVKTIQEATGYSSAETEKYYGMSSSIAQSIKDKGVAEGWPNKYKSQSEQGAFFKVGGTTKIYKNAPNGAKQLQWITSIMGEHVVGALMGGAYLYAGLLKYAGVNVDPTNPDTYYNRIASEGETWTPSSTGWMTDAGVNMAGVNDKRMAVLNAAYYAIQNKFVYNYGGKGEVLNSWHDVNSSSLSEAGSFFKNVLKYPENGVDCSGFIWWSYKKAGFDYTYVSTRGFSGSPSWERISFADLKAGDIVVRTGHHLSLIHI